MKFLPDLFNQINKFRKQKPIEFWALAFILLLAAFLRLYKIGAYMTFLGDEGRDAIIVRRLLVHGDPILIGPGTSIGNMYLGPLYYYFMAPSLLLANFSPVGPSVAIALLGVLTVFLVWYIAKDWFDNTYTALLAAALYAIAPTVIIYSRSSWNPNIMPFFALVSIYSIWKLWYENKPKWLVLTGISMAFVLQSHYLGLLLIPTLGLVWLHKIYTIKKNNTSFKQITKFSLIALIIFLALMSPLVIFDLRHNFINFNAIKIFFTQRQTTVSARPWNALPDAWPLIKDISTRLLAGRNEQLGSIVALGGVASLFILIKRNKLDFKKYYALVLIFIWLGFALLGLGVYKQHIYDHYYGFFFPAPFLLFAGVSSVLVERAKTRGWWLVATAFVFLAFYNILESPIKNPPNYQLKRSVEVAEKIKQKAQGSKFNLAVIAERNYEDAYQYFLERDKAGVVDIDPLNSDETITNQLFVVCELPEEKCDPTHNPKAEVANFGWTKIEDKWEILGVTIYKLVHTEQ